MQVQYWSASSRLRSPLQEDSPSVDAWDAEGRNVPLSVVIRSEHEGWVMDDVVAQLGVSQDLIQIEFLQRRASDRGREARRLKSIGLGSRVKGTREGVDGVKGDELGGEDLGVGEVRRDGSEADGGTGSEDVEGVPRSPVSR